MAFLITVRLQHNALISSEYLGLWYTVHLAACAHRHTRCTCSILQSCLLPKAANSAYHGPINDTVSEFVFISHRLNAIRRNIPAIQAPISMDVQFTTAANSLRQENQFSHTPPPPLPGGGTILKGGICPDHTPA